MYYCVFHFVSTVLQCKPLFFLFLQISQLFTKMDRWNENEIDALITNYVKHPTKCQDTKSIITHISEMQCVTKKDMVNIFNSISNYHWIDYPRFKNGKGVNDNSTRYSSHLLSFPDDRDRRIIYPHHPGCAFSNFTTLKKNTRMQFIHSLDNLLRKIQHKE